MALLFCPCCTAQMQQDDGDPGPWVCPRCWKWWRIDALEGPRRPVVEEPLPIFDQLESDAGAVPGSLVMFRDKAVSP